MTKHIVYTNIIFYWIITWRQLINFEYEQKNGCSSQNVNDTQRHFPFFPNSLSLTKKENIKYRRSIEEYISSFAFVFLLYIILLIVP